MARASVSGSPFFALLLPEAHLKCGILCDLFPTSSAKVCSSLPLRVHRRLVGDVLISTSLDLPVNG